MILIIGGAYQGKLDFAREKFDIKYDDVFFCSQEDIRIDFNRKIIANIDKFIFAMIKNNKDPIFYIKANIDKFKDKIITCEDISCGIVPIDYEMRIFRENIGHCLSIISKNSDKVVRLFCGIPMELK
ncbi:bifunctional adenosylcobinamide kinase/adenosylcobinamide-phosphate guanylyltransferase [uncultured Tyzzerella sp.]|uniref:bifunctional adenosylcobinamide kinase/adenosylcobinamide-phosphate guanylyltransferase n=1 Tax=uncultured Tyzzerella sp. TaxID=2321398 RepID=UPI002943A2E3|nr:bifunctional adenosylcobinamide kinase/adenosylcobinamide-phosphate guanylyltransferase [uncultured Tyzzerella sp.]